LTSSAAAADSRRLLRAAAVTAVLPVLWRRSMLFVSGTSRPELLDRSFGGLKSTIIFF
jgi:hypothetical protein